MKSTILILAAAGLLAACSSTASDPSPTTATTPDSSSDLSAWAGQVCQDTAALRTSITDIAGAVTSGGADLQSSIAQQFILIQESAQALVSTVGSIPAEAGDSPDALAIKQSSTDLNAAVTDLGSSVDSLKDASGISLATSLVGVGSAASAAGQAAVDAMSAIARATQNRGAAIGAAFADNPACTALTAERAS